MNVLLTAAYHGARYCGFQVQPNGPSVQAALQDAAQSLLGERPPITGCSRTDAGVHARGFRFTLPLPPDCRIPPARLPDALNAHLPPDIAILDAREVPDDFHPRYTPHTKEYRYRILARRAPDPFQTGLAWHYPRPLNAEKMQAAAREIVGRQDFRSFMAAGSKITDTVRTMTDCRVERQEDSLVLCITGDGFLYNMVRIIAGTLVSLSGEENPGPKMREIIAARDRRAAGPTAPPHGLYLWQVRYAALHEE